MTSFEVAFIGILGITFCALFIVSAMYRRDNCPKALERKINALLDNHNALEKLFHAGVTVNPANLPAGLDPVKRIGFVDIMRNNLPDEDKRAALLEYRAQAQADCNADLAALKAALAIMTRPAPNKL